MLTKLWRKLRQQDRVEELEASLKELDDELFTVAAREAKQGIRLQELEAENDDLLQYRDWVCVYCDAEAPLPSDHWRECPDHPARKRVEELEDLLDQLDGRRRHPRYGPCDALAPDGGCSMCQEIAGQATKLARIRAILDEEEQES